MSPTDTHPVRFRVDPANPGQFFACCGLLELADRLWDGAEGWFANGMFHIQSQDDSVSLYKLFEAVKAIRFRDYETGPGTDGTNKDLHDPEKITSPLLIIEPITLRLDWWSEKSLKPWAGSMDAGKMFLAMCNAIDPAHEDPLNMGVVVFDPIKTNDNFKGKKQRV